MTIQMMAPHATGGWDGRELLDADFDTLGDADDYGPWVDAAPFRAHVRHLMADSGVAWRTIAVLADVPSQSVDHLLRGRNGRPVPRLHPLIAERLFHLTKAAVDDSANRRIHAGRTQRLLQCLTARGWVVRDLARRARIPETELADLLAGRSPSCSQLVAATVKAAAQALWDRRPPTGLLQPYELRRPTAGTPAMSAAA
jgi:lambda repressor-like predicted transcriptional regulator